MKIATLNINSINARLTNLMFWLQKYQPDVMLLQEIKAEFNNFPFFDLKTIGYDAKVLGQKSNNGVAVLSKHPIIGAQENIPDFTDENARYLETEIKINNISYTIASLYVPNGNPPQNNPLDKSRYLYKLNWLDSFISHAQKLFLTKENIILGGDFNIIMTDNDVYNPHLFNGGVLMNKEVQNKLQALSLCGYRDLYRNCFPDKAGYTCWDYMAGSLQNDLGMRIDYLFTSPSVSDRCLSCGVDREFRHMEKSSDHTILWADFKE
ncbi:MAG: endonuclease/exonuclease/phosphatase family protein [Alphaproteobacteria bacterium]|nr:endonuclease/exonuclease/phosphatase family protein [Alphaproteobacteria bacterium]